MSLDGDQQLVRRLKLERFLPCGVNIGDSVAGDADRLVCHIWPHLPSDSRPARTAVILGDCVKSVDVAPKIPRHVKLDYQISFNAN